MKNSGANSAHQLKVQTAIGDFVIALDLKNAPITAGYYKELALNGVFDGTTVFRIVNEANAHLRVHSKIEVIQMGVKELKTPFAKTLEHETTQKTGLKHLKWTVSAARYEIGENFPSFFICMRDEPELDFGGKRYADGQGFAAFGKIIDGFSTLNKMFSMAEADEFLNNEIKIITTELKIC